MEAQAPFDSSAIADIILRSSDNIHFYVLSAFLYFVSHDQTFRDTLSASRGPFMGENETRGDLPIIDLSAHSETVYIVLELIYPRADEPWFRDLDVFRKVCKTAQFYSMTVVEDKLKKQILASQFIESEPLRLYAIAIDLGWEAVALAAARETLEIPLVKLAFIDELQDISGAAFYRFLNYRFRCDSSMDISRENLMMQELPDKKTNVFGSGAEAQGSFGASPTGNIVLRSSDSVDFFVIEGLIRFVSPFFDRKFPLEKPEEVDGRPVIAVPEDSTVLRYLLDLIYPGSEKLGIRDCHLYRELVRTARKFEMSQVVERLQKRGMVLAYKEPLRMYAIATRLGLDEVAKVAARETLSQPLREMRFVEELCQITGADMFWLMRYRFNCANAVRRVIKNNDVHTAQGFAHLEIQGGNSFNTTVSAPGELLVKLYQRMEDCPRGITYRTICASEVACRSGYHPSYCHINISEFDAMERYREGLVAAIEDTISKISLKDIPKLIAIQDSPSIEQTATSHDLLENLLVASQCKSAPSTKCKECRTCKACKTFKKCKTHRTCKKCKQRRMVVVNVCPPISPDSPPQMGS